MPDWKLFASNIETLYDNGTAATACRRFAVPDSEIQNDGIVPMTCFDDGSATDLSETDLEVVKAGAAANEYRNPEFIAEYDSVRYGESFRFDKVLYNHYADFDFWPSEFWEYIRCKQLENGDRVYYGIISAAIASEFGATFSKTTGAPIYHLWSLDDEGEETEIDSGAASGVVNFGSLAEGRYKITVTGTITGKMHSTVYEIISSKSSTTAKAWATSETDGEVQSSGVEAMYFKVYNSSARLAVVHHDISLNTATMYTSSSEVVSCNTRSISAVEVEGGVAIFYDHCSSWGEVASEGQFLSYKILTFSDGLYSDRYEVQLPNELSSDAIPAASASSYFVHAFDLAETDRGLQLVFSAKLPTEGLLLRSLSNAEVETDLVRGPVFSDGFYVVDLPFSGLDLGEADKMVAEWEPEFVPSKSFFNLFATRSDDGLSDDFVTARFEVDSLKLEWCEERKQSVVTALDWHHRCPVIFVGTETEWREYAVPLGSTVAGYIYYNLTSNSPLTLRTSFGYETAHATFGYDGRMYCSLNAKGESNCGHEIVLIDPQPYRSVRKPMIGRGPDWLKTGPLEMSDAAFTLPSGYYRQQRLPVSGVQGTDAYGPKCSSISRADQHLVVGLGGDGFESPLILQNMEYDAYPFQISEQDCFTPECSFDTAWTYDEGFGDGFYGHYFSIGEGGGELTRVLPSLSLQAVDTTLAADFGYKFWGKLEVGKGLDSSGLEEFPSATGLSPERPPTFEATGAYDDGDTVWKLQARFRFWEDDLYCETYNGSSWDTIHTVEGYLSGPEIVDYFILMNFENTIESAPLARLRFVYKRRDINVTNRSVEYLDGYHTDAQVYEAGATTESDASAVSSMSFSMGSGWGYNVMNVFGAGWSTLQVQDSILTYAKYNSDPSLATIVDKTPSGDLYRPMNDRWLLQRSTDAEPYTGFKIVSSFNAEKKSARFHWPNGFRYEFSGENFGVGDLWTLSRQRLADPDMAKSQRIHGIWWSDTDTAESVLYADAVDSNLSKFYVDTMTVMGCNVRKPVLVGKDSLEDEWTEIATLDLKKYNLAGLSQLATETQRDVMEVAGAAFLEGSFDRGFDHFYQTAGAQNAKVLNGYEDQLVLDTNSTREETEAVIFTGTGVLTLDEPAVYRYVGIKLDEADTREGYHKIESVDFGFAGGVLGDFKAKLGSGESFRAEASIANVVPEQASPEESRREKASFDLEYTFVDPRAFGNAMSVISKVSLRGRPVWLFYKDETDPSTVWLCTFSEDPDYYTVLDEDSDIYYAISFSLRSMT